MRASALSVLLAAHAVVYAQDTIAPLESVALESVALESASAPETTAPPDLAAAALRPGQDCSGLPYEEQAKCWASRGYQSYSYAYGGGGGGGGGMFLRFLPRRYRRKFHSLKVRNYE